MVRDRATVAAPSAAHAAYPGKNGKIAFVRDGDIWSVNPDGTNRVRLTTDPATDSGPYWSPDGKQIAFTSSRDGRNEVYVMNADGSDQHRVTMTAPPHGSAGGSWSPDGTQISYSSNGHLWVVDVDGTDARRVTVDEDPECGVVDWGVPVWSPDGANLLSNTYIQCFDSEYYSACAVGVADGVYVACATFELGSALQGTDWSPDSSRILMSTDDNEERGIASILPNGLDAIEYTDGSFADYFGRWSPDATQIVFTRAGCYGCDTLGLFIVDAVEGGTVTPLAGSLPGDCCVSGDSQPDWQPIPVNSYPRPKSATGMQVSLVPAYDECDSPNRTHGPPLDHPSCAQPQRTSADLTLGTPDANARPVKSGSAVTVNAIAGNLATPADEADIRLIGTIDDVRLAADLSDYMGSLSVRMSVQITDKDNTPHPGGPGAATVESHSFSFSVQCAATADTSVGADCSFNSTAEAVVPGIVKEGRRAVWQLGQVAVHDGQGNAFMRQGVFVP